MSLSAAGIVGPLTWLYAWRAGLVRPGVSGRYVRFAALRGFSVPIVMLGSLPFVGLVGSMRVGYLWILIVPVQLILNRVMHANEAGRPEG